jgi:hypothetical protein
MTPDTTVSGASGDAEAGLSSPAPSETGFDGEEVITKTMWCDPARMRTASAYGFGFGTGGLGGAWRGSPGAEAAQALWVLTHRMEVS